MSTLAGKLVLTSSSTGGEPRGSYLAARHCSRPVTAIICAESAVADQSERKADWREALNRQKWAISEVRGQGTEVRSQSSEVRHRFQLFNVLNRDNLRDRCPNAGRGQRSGGRRTESQRSEVRGAKEKTPNPKFQAPE